MKPEEPEEGWHPAEIVIVIMLICCILFTLFGCGGGGDDGPSRTTIPVHCDTQPNGCK